MSLEISEKRIRLIVWLLLGILPFIGMAVDLIAPSLPAISSSFHASAKIAKDAISVYVLGYAFGNFFTGFLTDALGRQTLLRLSVGGFVLVSLIPVFFPSIEAVLLARVLQGLTAGSIAVLLRTIFSDILPPQKLISLGTLMGTMWGMGPLVGPVIGGYLQFYFGWKAGFCFFAMTSFLFLIAIVILIPETHLNRHPLKFEIIKNNIKEVLSHRFFMALIVLMGMMYSLMIIFQTSGPFLIQTQLHYTSVFFGQLAFCLGVFFLAATFVCRYLLKLFEIERLYFYGIHLFFSFIVLMLVLSYFFSQSLVLIMIASAVMFFACGFIFPMSMGKGLSLFRHISGAAAATMYLFNMLITSLVGFLVSFLTMNSAVPLVGLYAILLLICVVMYWKWIRPTTSEMS